MNESTQYDVWGHEIKPQRSPPHWAGIKVPPKYDLRKTGVFRIDPPAEEGGDPIDVFISAPAWVRSFSVDTAGRWHASIDFVDRMDVVRTLTVPVSRLYGQAKSVTSELVGQGHYVGYDKASSLAKYLLAFRSPPEDVERRMSEDEQIIENIKEFILRNEDRFQSGEAFPVRARAGYRYKNEDWWSFTATALLEASGSHSSVKVARILKSAGYLVTNDQSNMMKCPASGGTRTRMYVIPGCILESEVVTLSAQASPSPPMPVSQNWAAKTRVLEPLAQLAQAAQVEDSTSQPGQENATNLIADDYQPNIHEWDLVASLMNPPQSMEMDDDDNQEARDLAAYATQEGIKIRC